MRRIMSVAALLAIGALAGFGSASVARPARKDRVYELRVYTANPGHTDSLHKRFREHTCELFKKHGMELVGFWTPEDEDKGKQDKLYYMLAFPSRDAAKEAWSAFSNDPEWQRVFKESHKDGVIVGKVESVYLDPTDYSPAK